MGVGKDLEELSWLKIKKKKKKKKTLLVAYSGGKAPLHALFRL